MDRRSFSTRLRDLASGTHNRSTAARLREVMDEIEVALAAGVSRTDVLVALKDHGIDIGMNTLAINLHRHRAKARRLQASHQVAGPPSQPLLPRAAPTAGPTPLPRPPSHNPADLDKIIGSPVDLDALAKHAKRRKP